MLVADFNTYFLEEYDFHKIPIPIAPIQPNLELPECVQPPPTSICNKGKTPRWDIPTVHFETDSDEEEPNTEDEQEEDLVDSRSLRNQSAAPQQTPSHPKPKDIPAFKDSTSTPAPTRFSSRLRDRQDSRKPNHQ